MKIVVSGLYDHRVVTLDASKSGGIILTISGGINTENVELNSDSSAVLASALATASKAKS